MASRKTYGLEIREIIFGTVGRDSLDGIATGYGLDGPWIEYQ